MGQLVQNGKVQRKFNDHVSTQLVDLTRYNFQKHFTEASKEAMQLAQSRADNYVSDLENIVQSLNDGKVPVGLITKEVGHEIFTAFNERAELLKCEPPLKSYHDIFFLDLQYVYSEEHKIIRVFLTAHMIPWDHKVPLYRYLPVPLVKSLLGNHTMTPVIREKNLIAYSNKDQYQEYSEVELGFCQLQGETYICKERNILRTDVDASCLAGLYTQNTEIVGRECLMEFAKPTEQIYVIGENTWLVNIPEGRHISVVCSARGKETRTHSSLFVKRMGILQMQHGCETQLGKFHIRTDAFENEVGEIRLSDWHCNPEDLFPPQDLEKMAYLAHQLEDSKMVEFTTDDIKALEYTSEVNEKSTIYIIITSVLAGGAIVAFVVVVYITYMKFGTFGHLIAVRIRSYHRDHHSDKPDVGDKDPVLYVPEFEKLYKIVVAEGRRRMGMSAAQMTENASIVQSPKAIELVETPSPASNQSASVVNSQQAVQQPVTQTTMYHHLPQHQMGQVSREQFQQQQPVSVHRAGYNKSVLRNKGYLATRAVSSVKANKPETSRKYEHAIDQQIVHLAMELECVQHDKQNGCVMAYTGLDEEIRSFVESCQSLTYRHHQPTTSIYMDGV